MTLQKRIEKVRDALLTVTDKVYHFDAPDGTYAPYIVWQEEGTADVVYADNVLCDRAIEGSVDYYTTTEYDPVPEQIEQAMTEADIAWQLYSILSSDGYTHYEWSWQV